MSYKKIIYSISCYVVGALFLFSGLTKAINPFGLSVQFGDYFTAMGLDFMHPMAPMCAVFLPMVEMLLGVMLILGYYRRVVGWIVFLFMLFFTGLTYWIMLNNPVKDCGCFGDILVISNTATFVKNVIFLIPTIAVVALCGSEKKSRKGWRSVVLMAMLCGLLPLYSYNNLPLIDATPFREGVNVWEAMHDEVADESKTTLIYRSVESGDEREFEIEDMEWRDDSKWEYVDTKTVVSKEGRSASISQLPMIDRDGVDRAEMVLNTEGEVLLMVSVNPTAQFENIFEAVSEAKQKGVSRIVLLHSNIGLIHFDGVEVYTTDLSTLRTIIQHSRGGKLWLEDGIIVEKSKF